MKKACASAAASSLSVATDSGRPVVIRVRTTDKKFVKVELDLVKKTATPKSSKHLKIKAESEAKFVLGLIKDTPITPERMRIAEERARRARAARAASTSAKHHSKTA